MPMSTQDDDTPLLIAVRVAGSAAECQERRSDVASRHTTLRSAKVTRESDSVPILFRPLLDFA
jgi:hypothetical protein